MQLPDFLMIPTLVAAEIWRRGARRLRSSRLYPRRYSGSLPTKVYLVPRDLRPADQNLAPDFYAGNYIFKGLTPADTDQHPFSITPPAPEWFEELHGFGWLRHLRAADTNLFSSHASSLVIDWIETFGGQPNHLVWRSEITARRLISWLVNMDMLIGAAPKENKQVLLRALMTTTRYLQNNLSKMRAGYPVLQTSIALTYATLCLSGREKKLQTAARHLDKSLEHQILSDGGHISRNPALLVEILADLLPLKEAFVSRGHAPSPTLVSTIDRMQAAVRFFRHSGGQLAQFNGAGETDFQLLKSISRFDKASTDTQRSMPQSGYERLSTADTVILVDTGKTQTRATAPQAMAGTLSFELSSNGVRFVANCGTPSVFLEKYGPYLRATAAHSTATVGETSSSRFAKSTGWQKLLPSPLISMPRTIRTHRQAHGGFDNLSASHDGYRPSFRVIHHRELNLSDNGDVLNGIDRFEGDTAASIVIRFHLPFDINASPLSSGHSILLAGPNNAGWTFTCIDAPIALEESIQFSGPSEPRKTTQITIRPEVGKTVSDLEVRWAFQKRTKKPAKNKVQQSTKNQDLPDLLSTIEPQQADAESTD